MGEPLSTRAVAKLSREANHTDFFFLPSLPGGWGIPLLFGCGSRTTRLLYKHAGRSPALTVGYR